MTDRERVIKALEYCAPGNKPCDGCPMKDNCKGAANGAMAAAIKLLKEQEPKKRESRATLPCKCGCKRRDHLYAHSSAWPVGLKCAKCGFTVWGDNATDVIRRWNEAVKQD